MTKIILIDEKTIHIEGYKHIITMDNEVVSLLCSKKRLVVSGSNLKIELLSSIELNIHGLITKVEWTKM